MIAVLTGVTWYLIVVLIFISLMIKNVEHISMCLLTICMSFSEWCLLRSSAHFKNQAYLIWSCVSCLHIWDESETVSAQLCPTLWDPMDYSPPGSSAHVILQARILEWRAILFSKGSSWPRDQIQVSHITGRFLTIWATRKAQYFGYWPFNVISFVNISPIQVIFSFCWWFPLMCQSSVFKYVIFVDLCFISISLGDRPK